MGGYKVQGRDTAAALDLVDAAKALTHAGCFSIVLEGVPALVAAMVTEAVEVSTIGIGAGPGCDGQVLVFHGVLGLEHRVLPKFVRRYADLFGVGVEVLAEFVSDVAESYRLDDGVANALGLYGDVRARSGSHTEWLSLPRAMLLGWMWVGPRKGRR